MQDSMAYYQYYLAGRFAGAAPGLEVVNPFDGKVFARVEIGRAHV